MKLEPVENSIGETIVRGTLPHGLTAIFNPRPEFSRTFGMLATHYGSLDSRLPAADGTPGVAVPDGVAHFLEHKLFEDAAGDVSLRFSSKGASCNAGTEFSKTSYHFATAEAVEENLELLLRFVYAPWFTAESVAKEQGIIEQEIRMYEDDPDWVVFFSLLESLYHVHPVRINIAGSIQSIRQITPELLYRCHGEFYRPANMVLVVAGGIDLARCAELAERTLASLPLDSGRAYSRPRITEPPGVRCKRTERTFSVSRPQVALGFKDLELPRDPTDFLRRDLSTRLLLDVLFAGSSPHHQRLYERGVIDDSFDASYSGEDDFGFSVIGAETDDPDRLVREVLAVLERVRGEGVKPDDFELARNRFLGRYVRAFNSAESLAGAIVTCHFRRVALDDLTRVAMQLTPADLERRLATHLLEENSAVSILRPNADAARG